MAKTVRHIYRAGKRAWAMAPAFGVPVSYRPMHAQQGRLLFDLDPRKVFVRDANGNETHVERALNVGPDGCAGSHERYSAEAVKMTVDYFASRPPERRPKGIIDIGGGDGELAARAFTELKKRFGAEAVADRHVVIADVNPEAMALAHEFLSKAGVRKDHIHTMQADIQEPEAFERALTERFAPLAINATDCYLMSSMVLHNREIRLPEDQAQIDRIEIEEADNLQSEHVWTAPDGRLVPNGWLQHSLVDLIARWLKVSPNHGILNIDFSIPPVWVIHSKPTNALSYYSDHADSRQAPVEFTVLNDAYRRAGAIVVAQTRFPASASMYDEIAVSLTLLKPAV